MKTKIRKKDNPAIIIFNKNNNMNMLKQSAENQNIKWHKPPANISQVNMKNKR